jgi:hypothetical protein
MRNLPVVVWGAIAGCLLLACGRGEPKASPRAADSATAQSPAPTPILRECSGTTISDSALGEVRLGQTVADVSARCTVVRDTTALRGEGQSARVIDVVVGPDTVEAEVVNDRVWRIGIVSPAFRTADSLGVGTRLPVLLAQPGARPLSGEGRVFVTTQSHCGLSFQLSIADTGRAAGRWTVDELRRLPDVIAVTRVLVIGCAK